MNVQDRSEDDNANGDDGAEGCVTGTVADGGGGCGDATDTSVWCGLFLWRKTGGAGRRKSSLRWRRLLSMAAFFSLSFVSRFMVWGMGDRSAPQEAKKLPMMTNKTMKIFNLVMWPNCFCAGRCCILFFNLFVFAFCFLLFCCCCDLYFNLCLFFVLRFFSFLLSTL